jgi:hypothetical protein
VQRERKSSEGLLRHCLHDTLDSMSVPTPSERFRRIAAAVDHLVEAEDEILLYRGDDGVEVLDFGGEALSRQHPELYGRLLSVNAQMQVSGLGGLVGFFLLGVFWLGEQAGWWDDWIGSAAERLNVWYVYVVLTVLLLAVLGILGAGKAALVYRTSRGELFALIHAASLDRDRLLVRINGDDELETVIDQLKLDRNPPAANP